MYYLMPFPYNRQNFYRVPPFFFFILFYFILFSFLFFLSFFLFDTLFPSLSVFKLQAGYPLFGLLHLPELSLEKRARMR